MTDYVVAQAHHTETIARLARAVEKLDARLENAR